MSATDTFTGRRYEIVAWARGQLALLYHEFGSYSGQWLLLARDPSHYFLYKDWYGSCSGCDSFEAEFDDTPTWEKAAAFADGYRPFIEVPVSTMRNVAINGTLLSLMPGNIREDIDGEGDDYSLADFAADATGIVFLEEGLPITVDRILVTKNQEVKQRLIKAYGYEAFVRDSGAQVIDTRGKDRLVAVGDVVFLDVKDASTPRRYLLRVPPDMKRVRQAVAWTFDVPENNYNPLVET